MDAVDALLCLGFGFVRDVKDGSFILLKTTSPCLDGAPTADAIRSCFAEMGQRPEHHKLLIQQKGMASGI